MLPTWLQNLVKWANNEAKPRRRNPARPCRTRPAFRPVLEEFESRLVPTSLDFTSLPTTVNAGNPFVFTVNALDNSNNPFPGYTGTVHFSSSDVQAALPPDSTLTNGSGSFGATLKTAGLQTLTATDAANSSITGNVTITVIAEGPTHFVISVPTSSTAGAVVPFTVTAEDTFNNVATSYSGTVHFSSSDPQAQLPPDATLNAGIGTFNATLETAGSQTLTATDAPNGISGSATVTVTPGAASKFVVSAPSPTTAGTALIFTVTAKDSFNNTAVGYTGTVHFTSSDPNASLPADTTLTSGTAQEAAFLRTAGNQTITATDKQNSALTGVSGTILVNPGQATHFSVIAPIGATAGTAFPVTVTAEDVNNNQATSYTGTVHFSTSASSFTLPGNSALTNGQGIFSVSLQSTGAQTLSVNDTVATSMTGSTTVTVTAGPATHFVLSAPSSTTAGSAFVFSITALDAANSIALTYQGTVHFTSSDPQANLLDATLTNGSGYSAAILSTAGLQTITATDTTTSSITGTSNPISVQGLAASQFAVVVPPNAITGVPFNFTVLAQDSFGNTDSNFSGTVDFSSTDSAATLPSSPVLTNGSGVYSATLETTGNEKITATDAANNNINGTSSAIVSRGLIVSSFTITPKGFIAVFSKPFNPTQLNIYDASTANFGPADVTLVGPGTTAVHGSLLLDPTDTTATFVKTGTGTSGVLAAGTYTVTLRSASNGFRDTSGILLDGDDTGMPGTNYTTTFVVASTPSVVLSIPDFARGPDSTTTINVPNTASLGIPITLTNATGVTSVTFNLTYNPALLVLNTTPTQNGASGTFTLVSNSGGVASFSFSTSTPLGSGTQTLGGILATVPNSAASLYKDKALLHLSGIVVNGGSITATANDGIEVVDYFGDVAGEGYYSPLDAALISRVAVGLDTGLASFPLLDPEVVDDLTNSGVVSSSDVTLLNRVIAGIAEPQLPLIPGALTVTPVGPDPLLSLPADVVTIAGDTVTVPVNIDTAHPAGSEGMMEASLALLYDPREYAVTPADVELGTVPMEGSGWQLQTVVNAQTGDIGIDLYSTTPIASTAGGSLVTITLHVQQPAPTGTAVLTLLQQANPTGLRVFDTSVGDALGAYVLEIPGRQTVGIGLQTAIAPKVSEEVASGPAPTLGPVLPGPIFGSFEPWLVADREMGNSTAPMLLNTPDDVGMDNESQPTVAGIDPPWEDCVGHLAEAQLAVRQTQAANPLDDAVVGWEDDPWQQQKPLT